MMRSEMCSLHLTQLGAVGSRLCSARGAVVDFLSETGFEPTTLGYLGLPRVSSPTLYPLGQRLPI